MMTGYEIVKRAIEFRTPERIPIGDSVFGESDFWGVSLETPSYPPLPGAREWGYTMRETDVPNNGMPDNLPLATCDMLDDFQWPDPRNPERYASIPARLADPAAKDKYIHMGWFVGLYDMVLHLRGWETSMLDFVAEPAKIKLLIAKVATLR